MRGLAGWGLGLGAGFGGLGTGLGRAAGEERGAEDGVKNKGGTGTVEVRSVRLRLRGWLGTRYGLGSGLAVLAGLGAVGGRVSAGVVDSNILNII